MYKWQRIKALHAQGVGIRQIARDVGVSRNTVRKYLKEAGPPQFKAREYTKELDKFLEEIKVMLAKGYIGTRIYKELKDKGYQGSLASVHRYLRAIKEDDRTAKLATTRVETGPGKQMQYDWKVWTLPVDGKLVKIYLHEVVLSYSRMKFYTFSLSITTADVIRVLIEAIDFFGGYAPELVIDNGKQMVITHQKDGIVRYNDEFLKFCGLYGIEPCPCANYRARTKGKVERPFYYVQEHLLRGLEVGNLNEFAVKLSEFQEAYNKRPHSTLGRPPEEMFAEEKGCLVKIPAVEPALLHHKEPRKVSNDGYISHDGNLYPVPMRYCLRRVWVENIYGRRLKVYDEEGALLAEFDLDLKKQTARPLHPEHETINRQYQEKKLKLRSALVEKFTSAFGEDGQRYLEGLRDKNGANLYWHLAEILSYQEIYTPEDIIAAIKECLKIGSYHKNSVKRLLERKEIAPLSCACDPASVNMPPGKIKRDLSCYALKESEVAAVS
ncbi:IS21 family transposase [Neomoorella thermoacetica]|uniref:Integrase core domain protein n=8 Tax=Neomoorella thermoacetica TaxID=1525 RepID=A0AAC9HFY0_NEOTH|nr:IS21 family transposase [Moorella thermoacetica]AKX93130.1 integrase core domain protein [Moorella thermoacetica]AKX94928.1 integrase core domain protein [Moorella thermoacetica]AKX95088.1 integrase core domain protein [Moorella thermoacetica]AKX97714.1 integrase core domain protein [Moorella thermoacetica]AOQ22671.1 Integrase core domain protein [Moorella thermoacetica]